MLGQRLAQIRKRRRLTQQDLAQKMGARYDQSFISKVEAGNRSLRLDGVIHASRALGVSTDYLLGEKRSPGPDSVIPPFVVPDRDLRDLAAGAKALNRLVEALEDRPLVAELTTTGSSAVEEPEADADADPPTLDAPQEVVESGAAPPSPEDAPDLTVAGVSARFHPGVRASAGPGRLVFEETEGEPIIFRRDRLPPWARSRRLSCIVADGDSMEPTIRHGYFLAVDPNDIDPINGQIYAVRTGDGLVVKRLRRAGDRWNLVSDNKEYPPRPMEEEDRIAGRVAPYGPPSAALNAGGD